jgi:acetate kinase
MTVETQHERPGGGRPPRSCILTINGGSSSLKFAVFALGDSPVRIFSGRVERVGRGDAQLVVTGADGSRWDDRKVEAPDQAAAADLVIERVGRACGLAAIAAIGHRIVHGGTRFVETELVSAEMLEALRRISPFDPDHLPGEIALIEALERALPGVPQAACFDTAFHREMPRVARIIPIPRRYEAMGVRRYGFHGLSYAFLMEELSRVAGREQALGKVILAHLGAGASLAAVHAGHCLDTSMGFTPAAGLVMGTRCGDIDPGLAWFLAVATGITSEQFHRMVNHESGLLGISEASPDLRDLLARREVDVRAAEAVDVFCYHVRKWIGAFAATLAGVETLVFSGGIGENSPDVRRGACAGLGFLGIELDAARNEAGAPLISTDASPTIVRVIRTDEELMIAREVAAIMSRRAQDGIAHAVQPARP